MASLPFLLSAVALIINAFFVIGFVRRISVCRKIRRKILSAYIKSSDVPATDLTDDQLKTLSKIYKKPFKDGRTVKIKGLPYYGMSTSQMRWYDVAIEGMRIETVHTPYDPISIARDNEFCDDAFNDDEVIKKSEGKKEVEIEGVIYKDCIYINRLNNIDLIEEIKPSLSLKMTFSPVNIGVSFLLISILFYIFMFISIMEPTTGTLTLLCVGATISIVISAVIVCFMTRMYRVEGVYKENKKFHDDSPNAQYIGNIGNVLVNSYYPLVEGQHYQALLKKESIHHTGLMDVEKLNGERYDFEKESMTVMLFVCLVIQLAMAISYYSFSKNSIQPELKALYEHNIERFGEEALGQMIDDVQHFERVKVGDSIVISNVYYSQSENHFLILDSSGFDDNKSLFGRFILSCSSDNFFEWINVIQNKINLVQIKFVFDGEHVRHQYDPQPRVYDKASVYKKMCRKPRAALRYAYCQDCSPHKHQDRVGVVTRIDPQNREIHLTTTLDVNNYPTQIARYNASVVILFSSIVYMALGMIIIAMRYVIYQKNRTKDKRWTYV